MKLTRKQKRELIYQACELLETQEIKFSCIAILKALMINQLYTAGVHEEPLVKEYSEWCVEGGVAVNDFMINGRIKRSTMRKHRIMALLMFAEQVQGDK